MSNQQYTGAWKASLSRGNVCWLVGEDLRCTKGVVEGLFCHLGNGF